MAVPDRRGWGSSESPEPYLRTSVDEQARDAESLLTALGEAPAMVGGAGLGAVVALEAALARPERVAALLLVEPPLLGFLPRATEGFSRDAEAIRAAVEEGGTAAAYELFLAGELTTIGAGAERLARFADRRSQAARSFLAELSAVPGWPFDPVRAAGLDVPALVVSSTGSPPLIAAASDELAGRLPTAERVVLEGTGPAHHDAAPELDRLLRDLAEA